mmetsp:Transcript_135/g.108  ORF Transcript_135/g.108 Transcript_135/m.108 type:complete len:401 (-) Transcript_135:9692-10894(-)
MDAGFYEMVIHESYNWENELLTDRLGVSWTTPISLEYIELPEARALIPDWLPSGAPELGEYHTVVVVGSNFTSFTECEVDGTISPTRWIASDLLECEIPSYGKAGDTQSIQLRERELYYSRDTVTLNFVAQSFVYRIEPQRIFVGRQSTTIDVYFADTEGLEDSTAQSYYCKFGDRAIRASNVELVFNTSEDVLAGHGREPLVPVARRKISCRAPLLTEAQTLQVEVLTPGGTTFSWSSVSSSLEVVARPDFTSMTPFVAPLQAVGKTPVDLTFTGENFDASFTFRCVFAREGLGNDTETVGTVTSSTELTCPVPTLDDLLTTKLEAEGTLILDIHIQAEWSGSNFLTTGIEPTSGIGYTDDSLTTTLKGRARVFAYQVPTITSLWPLVGSVAGGTPIYV